MLQLSQATPITTGRHRHIYQHPDQPDQLIKVMRTDLPGKSPTRGFRLTSRTGPYRGYVREFKEYLASRHADPGPSPLAPVIGLVDTDLGLGLVVQKISGADGGLAPTLISLIRRDGLTPELQQALDTLLAALLRHDVIATDLHAYNIVYGSDGSSAPRLMMIDGFGEKNIIPHRSMSRSHNAARTRRKFERMIRRCRAGVA
ncbi:MAG: YrbL family protein [Rhodanobacter sp.]|jgi:hypothetical protein